jgi:hypothetical protein
VTEALSLVEARRIALAAQGFGRKPAKATISHVRKLASKILSIQIDSINVLVRSHYMPAYSRLGPYPMRAIDTLTYERHELAELWGHAACLMPVEVYPLLRYRAEAARGAFAWSPRGVLPGEPYIEAVYDQVAERGPITARDLKDAGERRGKWWGWNAGKIAIEHLLNCGLVEVAGRRNFERLYDITERVIPKHILGTPSPDPEESQKQLMCLAAKAHGVATGQQLANFFGLHSHRFRRKESDGKWPKPAWPKLLGELVDEGRLRKVTVEGWAKPGYIAPGTRIPRPAEARALLSPFDSLMWGTAQQSFGFTQPLAQQLYVPAERRVYGYYVLPFLLDDALVARCDLKADRKRSVLMVLSAFLEPGHNARRVAAELGDELRTMQAWLQLDRIEVASKGNLASRVKQHVRGRN